MMVNMSIYTLWDKECTMTKAKRNALKEALVDTGIGTTDLTAIEFLPGNTLAIQVSSGPQQR